MKYTKGLIKFEGDTYWLNLGKLGGTNDKFECQILDNGKWRAVLKNEIDLFDLMERGEIIGDKKTS
jgi:hypothetical protein